MLKDMDYPMPNYTTAFREVIDATTPQEINRAIVDLQRLVPAAARAAVLRPATHAYRDRRLRDLLRTKMSRQQAQDFADAEARARQFFADITGDEETIESTVTILRPQPHGRLVLNMAPYVTKAGAAKLSRACGGRVIEQGGWAAEDIP